MPFLPEGRQRIITIMFTREQKNLFTCFQIKYLNKHEGDVHPSYSKRVFPHRPITFLLSEEILEGFLH